MSFAEQLNERLAALRTQGLYRELRRVNSAPGPLVAMDGKSLVNFSSNDYLGLAGHPAVCAAAKTAVDQYGAGAGAARLVCGSLAPFHELETALARFKNTEAALTFSTGYATAVGTIPALMGKDDIIILDKLVHASIVDAAKLSGAKLRVFAHNDLADLEEKLSWAANLPPSAPATSRRTLVVTESLFSMDGDIAPLPQIVALKDKYGAWLLVDEAHATGVLGEHGRGLAHALGVSSRIEIQMGTLGKALGSSGGFICGCQALIDTLVNRARSFIFSTAPVPAAAGAALAALQLVQSPEGKTLRHQLQQRITQLHATLRSAPAPLRGAIIPLILGDETQAVNAAAQLRERGCFVPAIRYPTVARGAARLRITVTAAHTSDQVNQLLRAIAPLVNRIS